MPKLFSSNNQTSNTGDADSSNVLRTIGGTGETGRRHPHVTYNRFDDDDDEGNEYHMVTLNVNIEGGNGGKYCHEDSSSEKAIIQKTTRTTVTYS